MTRFSGGIDDLSQLSCLQEHCGCCAELLLPAITRVAGIIGGVLLSLVLSVLLWPKSASEQAMRYAQTTCSPPIGCAQSALPPSLHDSYERTALNTHSSATLIKFS